MRAPHSPRRAKGYFFISASFRFKVERLIPSRRPLAFGCHRPVRRASDLRRKMIDCDAVGVSENQRALERELVRAGGRQRSASRVRPCSGPTACIDVGAASPRRPRSRGPRLASRGHRVHQPTTSAHGRVSIAERGQPMKRKRARRAGRPVVKRDGRWWVATLRAFPGAYGQGRTERAAIKSLASAVRDLIETYAELRARAAREHDRRHAA